MSTDHILSLGGVATSTKLLQQVVFSDFEAGVATNATGTVASSSATNVAGNVAPTTRLAVTTFNSGDPAGGTWAFPIVPSAPLPDRFVIKVRTANPTGSNLGIGVGIADLTTPTSMHYLGLAMLGTVPALAAFSGAVPDAVTQGLPMGFVNAAPFNNGMEMCLEVNSLNLGSVAVDPEIVIKSTAIAFNDGAAVEGDRYGVTVDKNGALESQTVFATAPVSTSIFRSKRFTFPGTWNGKNLKHRLSFLMYSSDASNYDYSIDLEDFRIEKHPHDL